MSSPSVRWSHSTRAAPPRSSRATSTPTRSTITTCSRVRASHPPARERSVAAHGAPAFRLERAKRHASPLSLSSAAAPMLVGAALKRATWLDVTHIPACRHPVPWPSHPAQVLPRVGRTRTPLQIPPTPAGAERVGAAPPPARHPHAASHHSDPLELRAGGPHRPFIEPSRRTDGPR